MLTTWILLCSNSGSQVSNVVPSEDYNMQDTQTVYLLLYLGGNILVCLIKGTGFSGDTKCIRRKRGVIEDLMWLYKNDNDIKTERVLQDINFSISYIGRV